MTDIPAQTAVAVQPTRSVLVAASERFGMEPKALEATLRGTVFPSNGTQAEFAAFLVVANEYGLNPMTREIYAYPKKGGGVQPIVSIDGWARIINEHPQFDGMSFEFEELAGKGPHGDVDLACTVTIWRKDRTKPTVLTEYLSECWRSTDPWRMKRRMLRHKALIQGARYAFGFASIMDEDEVQAITDTLTTVDDAEKPKGRGKRLSAGFAPKGDEVAPSEPQQAAQTQAEPEHIDAEFEAVDQTTGEVTDARDPVQTQATDARADRLADQGFSGEGLQQDDGMTRAIDPKQVAAARAAAEAEKKPAPLGSEQNPPVTPAEAQAAGTFFHVQSDPVNASGQRPFYDEDGNKRGFAMEKHGLRVATDLTGANTTTWAPQAAAEDDAPFDADDGQDEGADQSPWDVFDALLMSSADWMQIKRAMGELARNPVWNADEAAKASCRAKTWAKAKAIGIDPAKDATAFQCFLATTTAPADIDAIFADAIREPWYTGMEDAGRNAVTRAVMTRKKALA